MTEPAELVPVYKEAYTLIKGIHFRLTFELFISKLYWNYIDVKYCVKEELQLCYKHLQRFVTFGYIKFTWQQYNCKLRCAIESTTVLFSRSVNTNNIYATTGQSRNRIGNYVVYHLNDAAVPTQHMSSCRTAWVNKKMTNTWKSAFEVNKMFTLISLCMKHICVFRFNILYCKNYYYICINKGDNTYK